MKPKTFKCQYCGILCRKIIHEGSLIIEEQKEISYIIEFEQKYEKIWIIHSCRRYLHE